MKKLLVASAVALLMGIGVTSCSNDEIVTLAPNEIVHHDFQTTFKQYFGTDIDSKQDWGFKDISFASTRSAYVNKNEWGKGYYHGTQGFLKVPKAVTAFERDTVYKYFNKKREKLRRVININWTDYCISHVWKGNETYYDWSQYQWTNGEEPVRGALNPGANKNVYASNYMDHIQVLKGQGSIENGQLVGDNWEHGNDFNVGNNVDGYETVEGHTYMLNSGTLDFAYHNTLDSKYHNDYIIIAGADIHPDLAGFYYVGFDFMANDFYVQDGTPQHLNMCVDRDWFFTDWIVRISPAEFEPYVAPEGTHRIIAEDLAGGKSDFDYNDVVFDVMLDNYYNTPETGYQNMLAAKITVLAAGGTMPLYIGGKENGREVHELFGVSTKTMVNTHNGTVSKRPVSFVLILRNSLQWNETYNLNQIPVVVETPNGDITLETREGNPAEKICVGTTYSWSNERESIKNKYPHFKDWVHDHNFTDWYATE